MDAGSCPRFVMISNTFLNIAEIKQYRDTFSRNPSKQEKVSPVLLNYQGEPVNLTWKKFPRWNYSHR